MLHFLRAVAALTAAAACLAGGAQAAHAKTLDVVILGDSYASGVGGGDYSTDCRRSPNAWGEVYAQLARAKGLTANVTNAACGGSTVTELDTQIPAVTSDTDLVLMTTGGNDTNVSNSVVNCFWGYVAGPNACRSVLEPAIAVAPSIEPALAQRFRVLRSLLHPGAKIVFASYPNLAQAEGFVLKTWFASYDSGAAIRRLGAALDTATLGAINTVNAEPGSNFIRFVSTKARFVGHEPDADPWHENPARWIYEFNGVSALFEPYHPTVEGHRQIAAAVMAAAGPAGDFGVAS